jgi:hypothetical protein
MFSRTRRFHRRVLLVAGACAALMALPATAVAQDALSNPSADQYIPQSQVQGSNTSGGGTTGSANGPAVKSAAAGATATEGPSGSLPFTGMDLAVVAGVAVTMLGAGLALRRLSTPRTPGI